MLTLDKLESSVWVEKYRPKTLEDLVLPDEYRNDFKRLIAKQQMNNLLLHGSPGGGKSAFARIMTSPSGIIKNPKYNVLVVNGSSKKSRGISFVDDVIEPFLKVPPAGNDKYKIVFIDEGDNLTPDGFKSLRGLIEKFLESYGRFIITGNYISKIPDPVRSRFDEYHFKQLPKEFVLKFCIDILDKETIKYKEDDINFIINTFYPDVRKIINRLERCGFGRDQLIVNKERVLSAEKIIINEFLQLVDAMMNKENAKIGKLISSIQDRIKNPEISFRDIYIELFDNKNIPGHVKIIINKTANKHMTGLIIPHMNFSAMIFEIIEMVKRYNQLSK